MSFDERSWPPAVEVVYLGSSLPPDFKDVPESHVGYQCRFRETARRQKGVGGGCSSVADHLCVGRINIFRGESVNNCFLDLFRGSGDLDNSSFL